MNGHADTANERNGGSGSTNKKPRSMMKDLNLLGNMPATPPPINKLPKIPKIKKEPSSPSKSALKSPLKSPSKSPLKSPTKLNSSNKVKDEDESPQKPLTNGTVAHKQIKNEESDDDTPLAATTRAKKEEVDDVKVKVKRESDVRVKRESDVRKRKATTDEDEDFKESRHKKKKKSKDKKPDEKRTKGSPKKKVKKEEEEVWRWWDEEPHPEGVKWNTLEHNGPYFPPAYIPMPKSVKFYYNGEHMELSPGTEEVATFYSKMLEHDYTKKEMFNNNFFEDWRKEMTSEERSIIKKLEKCNFKEMSLHFEQEAEARRNRTKEEKNVTKEENAALAEEYGFCMMDGHKQKLGNFRIEPPGLFRGRGDHPKQGKLKKRVKPKEVIINIGKGVKVPAPPPGEKWKAVQHDNTVSWLACWIENIAGSYKYVMLNAATRLKGSKDLQKYEIARNLKKSIDTIRLQYKADWKSKEMRLRQRGVAMYFIDKLALRAGHEKEEGESADTVGCCSLRVEHIKLHPEKDDQEFVVEFDFLGKDSIRYTNNVPVEKRVFKNLEIFKEGKQAGDDLFDRLSTTSLNKFLGDLMPGLSAKVFRTYNASVTLQQQLIDLTEPESNVSAKFLQYNRANRAVAILCNHQRAAPKTFDKQMENLVNKLKDKKKAVKTVKKEVKNLKREYHEKGKSETVKNRIEQKKKQMKRLEEQYFKLEVSMTDKEENKEIALGTSKLNYLDPRISVAWCKKYEVPIEKVYNKTQRQKFQWAIDMTDEDFIF